MAEAALISTLLGAGLTVASARKQRQAVKAQKKEQKIARRQAEVRNRRERLRAAERRRVQSAQIRAEAENRGVGGQSSLAQGALGALGSQFGSDVGFQRNLESFNAARFSESQRAASATSQAALLGAGASIFSSITPGTFGAFTPEAPKAPTGPTGG